MPRVSIGMPVYNGERYLRFSLESLLGQTWTDFELVISDNASTDGTQDICREYEGRDRRVRYTRTDSNIGGPANFRRVFRLCTGEYHKWSTADDYWDLTTIEKCVAVLDQHPDVVLAYPKSLLEDADGKLLQRYDDHLHLLEDSAVQRFKKVVETATLCHAHLGVLRRSVMEQTALIGNELASDLRFLAEMSLYGKFYVVPEHLFHRRFHEASSSWDRQSVEWQRQYYDPSHRSLFGLHTWRRYFNLGLAVAHSPLTGAEKWSLLKYVGRKARWQRGKLWAELKAVAHSGT